MHLFGKFLGDESGATAIEYGLIAAGISVAIIATVVRPRLEAQHHLHQRQQRVELSGPLPGL